MVSIWTNRYSQGYSSAKNATTPIKGDNWSIIARQTEDIEVLRDAKSYKKLLSDCFLIF